MVLTPAKADDNPFLGKFSGTGSWVDESTSQMQYDVTQEMHRKGQDLALGFVHVFPDGTDTNANFQFVRITDDFYTVLVGEQTVGKAYCSRDFCSYFLDLPGNHVSVRITTSGDHLLVSGYSTKNSEGKYIIWNERLKKD